LLIPALKNRAKFKPPLCGEVPPISWEQNRFPLV